MITANTGRGQRVESGQTPGTSSRWSRAARVGVTPAGTLAWALASHSGAFAVPDDASRQHVLLRRGHVGTTRSPRSSTTRLPGAASSNASARRDNASASSSTTTWPCCMRATARRAAPSSRWRAATLNTSTRQTAGTTSRAEVLTAGANSGAVGSSARYVSHAGKPAHVRTRRHYGEPAAARAGLVVSGAVGVAGDVRVDPLQKAAERRRSSYTIACTFYPG